MGMTLDEAIAQERKKACSFKHDEQILNNCEAKKEAITGITKAVEYHEQLAMWLEKLKWYEEKPDGYLANECELAGYNKAIDDFVNAIKAKFPSDKNGICNIEIIAEQLKAGE